MYKTLNLNLARNCLKYIIRIYGIKEIFIPYYICPTVWQAIKSENCKIKFYHINSNFYPTQEFEPQAFILYVNYFGLCDDICENLYNKYPNLIIDNSQAYYSPPRGLASFNSLRKFFKLQNGARVFIQNEKILEITNIDKFLYKPIFIEENHEQFIKNELLLNQEKEIKLIDNNVLDNFNKIDQAKDKLFRQEYYQKYAKIFDKYNNIKLPQNPKSIPYCYPLNPKDETIAKILAEEFIILQLWKNFPKDFPEAKFLNPLLALPLNNQNYAKKIIETFK